MNILSCAGEKFFETDATGAYTLRFDCIICSGLSSIMRANPALLKLASVFKTSCFPGMGCLSTNSQASLRAFLTESIVSFNSDVMLIGTCGFKHFVEWFYFLNHPGKILSVVVHEFQVSL